YNASDLCIAEDKIFFAERDTRYLYSMNLDGSNVQQLNAAYSRCINYMNGQLYYYGSKENNRTIYSCDLNGNITGRYASGAKFLMLMGQEIYYYDWDEQLHILSLSEKSESDNYIHGTNITLYQQEEVLAPVRIYLDNNWSGYTLDESTIIKDNAIWMMTLYYNSAEYQIVIDLTTGRMTITCLVNDILPTTIYLYDNNNTVPVADTSIQLSEDELRSLADNYVPYGISVLCFEYHDYDKNGTYEAYAILGSWGQANICSFEELIFISCDGKITSVFKYNNGDSPTLFDTDGKAYIEHSNKGFFVPTFSTGTITYNSMFSVKNNEPFEVKNCPTRVWLDEDGNLTYHTSGSCIACYNNIEHKHVLIYNDDTQSV
ncbi:MAG: DUF5050 domain-containing protein, partial [Oscillospiraceae bacterium]|nr:DUF5050 domain-containing protein [Oscillospiraceae bacterium]